MFRRAWILAGYCLWALTASAWADPPPGTSGACCYEDGTCVFVAMDACAGTGGVFQGAGVDCAAASCPLPSGACCLADSMCSVEGLVDCLAMNGVFQGAGLHCNAIVCGACCTGFGVCIVTDQSSCSLSGGQAQGPGTTCPGVACPMPACCLPDSSCLELSMIVCEQMGGLSSPVGTDCTTASCGACCMPTAVCTVLGQAVCAAAGGTHIAGMSCAAVICEASACCFDDGSCQELDRDDCENAGGVITRGLDCAAAQCGACCLGNGGQCRPLGQATCATLGGVHAGAGAACTPAVCPGTGACCIADGTCVLANEATCTANLGMFIGAGADCATADCPSATGACCLTGACVEAIEIVCAVVGGVYRGNGTPCLECPSATGACCLPSGCVLSVASDCAIAGGIYQGDGITCVAQCPQGPLGACCLPGLDFCIPSSAAACASSRGLYMGDGTLCADTLCEDFPIGACCLLGACFGLFEDVCLATGGVYFGDDTSCAPSPCEQQGPGERAHPGWNWVDNAITLTANEPAYWSALTGLPKGLSPFTVLDPGDPPGRPAMDGTDDRVLRGYIVGWAVDQNGHEIRWNHLKGEGTIVNYGLDYAWEYSTWNHAVVSGAAHGEPLAEPGVLRLDGNEYSVSFDELLLNFQAAGSDGFSNAAAGFMLESDTDLTLHPPAADLRQNSDGPITTKASIDIWNENETKFSGTHRCITCWDQTLIGRYDVPNSFLYPFLQTDHGKARIDGHAAGVCDVLDDPDTPQDESVTSVLSPLLGVYARLLCVGAAPGSSASGSNLVGLGTDDTAAIRYDVAGGGGPPEAQWPGDPDAVIKWLERLVIEKTSSTTRGARGTNEASALSGPGQDRVSATEKGSLVFFTKVEIRWDRASALVQDTFLSLTNDYPGDVRVQLYFINGDAPLEAAP